MTVVGLGVAVGAVQFAQTQLAQSQAEAAVVGKVAVVVVAEDIPFGQTIERHMLTTIPWDADTVPSGVFTSFSDVVPDEGSEFRRATRALSQGEFLLASKVSGFGEKVTIVQTIADGHRAMAIEVDAQSGVGGFVTPGDFVDIVLTQGRDESLRAVTILQNIRVVGVDQQADEELDTPGIARTVTVEVTPQQSQRVALAQKAGQLSLSLRGLNGNEDMPLESLRLSDLMQDMSPVEQGPAPIVRVRRSATTVEEVPITR